MLNEIEKVVEQKIRPYLESHGGDIEVVSVENGTAKIRMLGNCSGCPSARLTVEDTVKSVLTEDFPEIKDVEIESQISEDMLDLAKKILCKG